MRKYDWLVRGSRILSLTTGYQRFLIALCRVISLVARDFISRHLWLQVTYFSGICGYTRAIFRQFVVHMSLTAKASRAGVKFANIYKMRK